uniref:Uncharacterized protein n=1 Tax=Plectus sambesii TaxID=2011161 RepID=A0A914WAS5_9BILA
MAPFDMEEDCPEKKLAQSIESSTVFNLETEETTTADLENKTVTDEELNPITSTEESTNATEATDTTRQSTEYASKIMTGFVTGTPASSTAVTEAATNEQPTLAAKFSTRSYSTFFPSLFSTSTSASVSMAPTTAPASIVPTTAGQYTSEAGCHDTSIFCPGFRRLCNAPRGCQRRRQARSLSLKIDDELACVWVRMQKQIPTLRDAVNECDASVRHIGAAEGISQGRMNKSPRRLRQLDCDIHKVVTSVFVALCPASCGEC